MSAHLCPQLLHSVVAAITTGLSEAKTLRKFEMKTWSNGTLVTKSILTSVGSPLEDLALQDLDYGEYIGCIVG